MNNYVSTGAGSTLSVKSDSNCRISNGLSRLRRQVTVAVVKRDPGMHLVSTTDVKVDVTVT